MQSSQTNARCLHDALRGYFRCLHTPTQSRRIKPVPAVCSTHVILLQFNLQQSRPLKRPSNWPSTHPNRLKSIHTHHLLDPNTGDLECGDSSETSGNIKWRATCSNWWTYNSSWNNNEILLTIRKETKVETKIIS